MSDTAPARYTTAHVPADYTVRISAATASRDYTATVVPGDYPIEYTDVSYHPVRDGERPYYVTIHVQIDTPTRTESAVEFGGVALDMRDVAGERLNHISIRRAYEWRHRAPVAIRLS